MAKRVLITGAAGIVGTVLRSHLSNFEITLADTTYMASPNALKLDVAAEYDRLLDAMKSHDSVIHLAWDSRENSNTTFIAPENKTMAENIYEAALHTNPRPRVIMASSIHAVYGNIKPGEDNRVTLDMQRNPTTKYGATKGYIELLGSVYALKGLQVVAVRLGHIYARDKDELKGSECTSPNYLSHRDCTEIFRRCVEAENLPQYCVLFAVSNNANRVVDISQTIKLLGFTPQDDSAEHL